MKRILLPSFAWLLAALLAAGCPHRSPLWSPDGKRVLILGGAAREEVDKAASQLWLATVEPGAAKRLPAPQEGVRYLAAAWTGPDECIVFTGKWLDGYIESGSEKVWSLRPEGGVWREIPAPPPAESRATRRLPVVIGEGEERAFVYPSAEEAVVVAALRDGKVLGRLEPAELVGPGPQGGFIIYRPEAGDTGGMELAAIGRDLKPLWQRKFSALRDEAAVKLGRKPVEVVFNDASTSHLPFERAGKGGSAADWFGITMVFSDVGWKEGITGYYLELEAASGKVLSAVSAVGLSGKPESRGGEVWGVTAPDPKRNVPVRVQAFDLRSGKPLRAVDLPEVKKEQVHGYGFDPEGKRFAVALGGESPVLRIYDAGKEGPAKDIRLE